MGQVQQVSKGTESLCLADLRDPQLKTIKWRGGYDGYVVMFQQAAQPSAMLSQPYIPSHTRHLGDSQQRVTWRQTLSQTAHQHGTLQVVTVILP